MGTKEGWREEGETNEVTNVWYLAVIIWAITILDGCNQQGYEVLERSEKEVSNFQGPGTHTEMDYVLLHDGHKIQASCDFERFASSDPESTCAFRILKSYPCASGRDSMMRGDSWDLKCKDGDGQNVYLYVSRKE